MTATQMYTTTTNNNNNQTVGTLAAQAGVMSDMNYIIADALITPIFVLLSFLGVFTNSLNIGTFTSMGLKDGVNLSFFCLSFADFSFAFVYVLAGVGRFLVYLEREHGFIGSVSPLVFMTIGHFGSPFATITCIATAFIAVVRCACVVRPLQFKNMFTFTKTAVILGGSATLFITLSVPIMAGFQFVSGWDAETNVTRIVVVETADNQDLLTTVWIFGNTVIPIVTQIVVMVCVPVLINALKAASSFRGQSKGSSATDDAGAAAKGVRLDAKDAHVVAQVVFISVFFVTCNFTVILYCIVARAENDFFFGKRYNNIHNIVVHLVNMSLLTSGVLNIFVYLKYNSSFRSHFLLS